MSRRSRPRMVIGHHLSVNDINQEVPRMVNSNEPSINLSETMPGPSTTPRRPRKRPQNAIDDDSEIPNAMDNSDWVEADETLETPEDVAGLLVSAKMGTWRLVASHTMLRHMLATALKPPVPVETVFATTNSDDPPTMAHLVMQQTRYAMQVLQQPVHTQGGIQSDDYDSESSRDYSNDSRHDQGKDPSVDITPTNYGLEREQKRGHKHQHMHEHMHNLERQPEYDLVTNAGPQLGGGMTENGAYATVNPIQDSIHNMESNDIEPNKHSQGHSAYQTRSTNINPNQNYDTVVVGHPRGCPVDGCVWSVVGFGSRAAFDRHVQSWHTSACTSCLLCSHEFSRRDALIRHVKTCHPDFKTLLLDCIRERAKKLGVQEELALEQYRSASRAAVQESASALQSSTSGDDALRSMRRLWMKRRHLSTELDVGRGFRRLALNATLSHKFSKSLVPRLSGDSYARTSGRKLKPKPFLDVDSSDGWSSGGEETADSISNFFYIHPTI